MNAYKFDKLETVFFDPPKECIDYFMQSSAVSSYIAESNFKNSVDLITGVKIARGAEVTILRSRGCATSSRIGADGTLASFHVAAGPEFSAFTHNSDRQSFGGSSDFVFAY